LNYHTSCNTELHEVRFFVGAEHRMADWGLADIPSLRGRSAVVTGPGGIGFETGLALAAAGAEVILAGRDPSRGAASVAAINRRSDGPEARFEALDLARLRSIEAFGDRLRGQREGLDILVNNAGVMAPPRRRVTADGLELQFGVNHLGHFALASALLPLLRRARNPRVVCVSSIAARRGAIHFADLQSERSYAPMRAYAQSKLANLLFAFELQRRSAADGWGVEAIAAHPGVAATDLIRNGAGERSLVGFLQRRLGFLFQPAAQAALPSLYAATAPDAKPGGYYGAARFNELRGPPAPARTPSQALDAAVAARLWDVSERLAGVWFGGDGR
jgi:NAD(P)-dependent dehydrogenase (short-subunit alcohol dehydrogenase family)